jgi:hypothetical protein
MHGVGAQVLKRQSYVQKQLFPAELGFSRVLVGFSESNSPTACCCNHSPAKLRVL